MLRSMYSGISGMKNFQVKLDVIGNNISNVNTYGFKKGRTTFKDMVSQQISGASAPGNGRGGVNPKQVGLGAQMGTIDTVHTQGSLQTTGRTLDLSISGDGFFVLGNDPGSGTTVNNPMFTRAGNFYLDKNGDIVNADGYYLMGEAYTINNNSSNTASNKVGKIKVPTDAKSFSIGSDGTVNYVDKDGNLKTAGVIRVAKFSNNDGLEKIGQNLFKNTANSGSPDTDSDGLELAELDIPGSDGAGSIVAGTLEMSNVDLSEEFTEMIVAQRGFQANTRIITTSDQILEELVNLKR
ncbi:flagellar basal body rod protein FlgG [Bacillus songklensis]|uniref:Flagellar hook protein FlgE n=1 Tax=Bacillus songklensis TaxID=1069116 RepID=A0ABV8B021_9BACI